jgi:hypothetical protein
MGSLASFICFAKLYATKMVAFHKNPGDAG